MKKILVIGSVNIDYTIYVDKFPKVGETLLGKNKISSLGGKGVNQAIASANAGGDTKFLCFVGKDDCASQIKKEISKYNLNAIIEEVNDLSSGNAFIFVDNDSNNEIVVVSGANFVNDVSLIEKHKDIINEADYIILQNEINPLMNEYIIKKYGKSHKIILNPAPASKISDDLLPYLECITPNEGELKAITGKNKIEDGVNFLLNKGLKSIIVTLGEKGSIYFEKGVVHKVDTFIVDSIDTVAAGDTFLGSYVAAISKGYKIKDALRFASASAALSTTKKGAAPSIPYLKDIKKLLGE